MLIKFLGGEKLTIKVNRKKWQEWSSEAWRGCVSDSGGKRVCAGRADRNTYNN